MTRTQQITEESDTVRQPKYYEVYGAEMANKNRAWLVAFLSLALAALAVIFGVVTRLQPPTVIRIGANGEAMVLGKSAKQGGASGATAGIDPVLNQAFVKRFLSEYLNYVPSNVDDHWASALNMMTRNLRSFTLKSMADDNTRGKIDDGQIQSVFHLREIDTVSGEPLTFLAYGVKDVHHVVKGSETTDHFVNQYRIRLVADRRSDLNPDGLWVASYNERPIDEEQRDRILAEPDTALPQE